MRKGVFDVSKSKKLTPEQEETRIHGLRILARLIARRHLALMRAENDDAFGPVGGHPAPRVKEEDGEFAHGQSIPPSEETDE